jgi:hypothetical protein
MDGIRDRLRLAGLALADIPVRVDEAGAALHRFPTAVATAGDSLRSLPTTMRELNEGMASVSSEHHRQLTAHLERVLGDVQAIDALVDEVIKVLEARLPALG